MPFPLLAAWAALPLLAKVFAATAATGAVVGGVRAATGTEMDKEEDDREPFEESRSAFGEVMDWVQLAGQPVQNMFAGRWGAAGRTAAETTLRLLDVLPGDIIPSVVKRSDITSPTEVIADAAGANPENVPWYVRFPVDVAGDIVTNPTSLLSFGATGAASKVARVAAQADNTASALSKTAAAAADDVARETLGKATAAVVTDKTGALAREVEAGLTRSARKAIRETGEGTSDFARRLITETAADQTPEGLSALMQRMSPGGELGGMFQQGGIQFAGKHLVKEGVPTAMAGEALGGAMRAIERLNPSVARALTTGGQRVASMGKKAANLGAELSGRVAGVNRQMLSAIRNRMRIGDQAAAVSYKNLERVIGDIPKTGRQDIMEAMFNATPGKDGKWVTASERGIAKSPFMTREQQVSLFMDRVNDLKSAGKTFGGMSDEAIQSAASDIINQNATWWAQDIANGIMKVPKAYVGPEGFVTLDDLMVRADEAFAGAPSATRSAIESLKIQKDSLESALESLKATRVVDDIPIDKFARASRAVDEQASAYNEALDALEKSSHFEEWLAKSPFKVADVNPEVYSPPLYAHRMWTEAGDDLSQEFLKGAGSASFSRARTLRTQDQLIDTLNRGEKTLNMDMTDVLLKRAGKQGRSITRAQFYKSVLGPDAPLTPHTQDMFNTFLQQLSIDDPDLARGLLKMATPMGERKGAFKLLNKVNRYFKGSVLYGLFAPRLMGFTRNRLAAPLQEASEAAARLSTPRMIASDLRQTYQYMGRRYGDAVRKIRNVFSDGVQEAAALSTSKDAIRKYMKVLDDATELARGDYRNFDKAIAEAGAKYGLDKAAIAHLLEANSLGVLDGFVSTEQLTRKLMQGKKWEGVLDWLDVPAETWQHVEHRMRLGQYMDLRRMKTSADEAARAVQSSYLDYTVAGVADRNMRDVIPFAAFITRSIPQQFRAVSKLGPYRSGLASVYGTERQSITMPPWVEQQASVDLGIKDKQGNPVVAAGLGLPVEVLNLIPSGASPSELFRFLRRTVVAQSNPVLKEGFARLAGRDPFFGTKVGSYDKSPAIMRWLGADERGEAGRFAQDVRRTGLTAPIESIVTQADIVDQGAKALAEGDPIKAASAVARLFSGMRFVSVDEQQALVQQLQEKIETDPRVLSGEFVYTKSSDPATKALVDAFKRAKAAVKRDR